MLTLTNKKSLKKILEPKLEEAKAGLRHILFMDAAHFVFAPFFGIVWCFQGFLHTMMWCSAMAASILAFRGMPCQYPRFENMAINISIPVPNYT